MEALMEWSRDASTADLYLEYGSNKVGFRLLETEGVKGWRPGWAPVYTPQFRNTAFDYTHYPPEVDIPIAFEDWSGGAGYEEAEPTENTPTVYSYSRNVDCSYRRRALLAPALQTMALSSGSELPAAPTKFIDASDGFFVINGAYIHEWTASSQDWAQRDDASAGAEDYTDIIEMNGTLTAARGDDADYKTSPTGVTWTAFTAEDKNQQFLAVRGISSGNAVMWGLTGTGELRNTTDPTQAGWTNDTAVAHTSETFNGFLEVDDRLFVFTNGGIYSFDGSTREDVWTGGRQMRRTSNGKSPFLWSDGAVYVPYGDRLFQYDPNANDGGGALTPVYPAQGALGHEELNGTIQWVAGDADWLYFGLKNAGGDTYVMKGLPGGPWHSYLYLGANDSLTGLVAAPGSVHSTNPALVFGYGTGARYVILPRQNLRPDQDSACRFVSTGTVYGPKVSVGTKQFPKMLNGGRVLGEQVSAGKPITLKYEIDENGTETTLATANTSGGVDSNIDSEVLFKRIEYVAQLDTGDETVSPMLLGLMFNCLVLPPRKRMWEFDVVLSPGAEQVGGGSLHWSAREQETFLFSTDQQRVTLYDRSGRTFSVLVQNLHGGPGIRSLTRGDQQAYTVMCTEISETTETTNTFTLDLDAMNSSKVLA